MDIILYSIIISLLQIVPVVSLYYTAFKNDFRFNGFVNSLLFLFLLTLSSLTYYAIFIMNSKNISSTSTTYLLISISFNLLVNGIFLLSVKKHFLISFFVFSMIKNYLDLVTFLSQLTKVINPSFYQNHPIHIITLSAILFMISLPFFYFFIKKLLNPVIHEFSQMPVWRYLWIVPFCFFLLYRFCINSQYQNIPLTNALLLPIVWFLGTFATYYAILKMLQAHQNNTQLTEKLNLSDYQITLQRQQYNRLQSNIKSTAAAREELKENLTLLDDYSKRQDFSSISHYIQRFLKSMEGDSALPLCENTAIDAIAQHYLLLSQRNNIDTTLTINLPKNLCISESDVCVVFGNLFENAVEACLRQKKSRRFIIANIGIVGRNNVVLTLKNSYEHPVKKESDVFLSSKRPGEGIGIASVCKIVTKYTGISKFEYNNGVFNASVLLNKPLLK